MNDLDYIALSDSMTVNNYLYVYGGKHSRLSFKVISPCIFPAILFTE